MRYKGMRKIGYIFSLATLLFLKTQPIQAFQPDSLFADRLKIIEKNIPYQLTEELQNAINRKMFTNQTESELILTRSIAYLPLIEKELWQNDLPSEFKYIPIAMSGMDPTCITYNGGSGIWGLQYIIAKRYGLLINEIVDERRDQIKSTCVSIHYIQDLQKNYGNWALTLLSFITSQSDVNSAICRSGNSSDIGKIYEYITNKQKNLFIEFIASAYLLNYYEAYGIEKKQPEFEWANCNSYPVETSISFVDLSTYLGIPENTLKQANPTIRSKYIPGNKGYSIKIPTICGDKFSTYKPVEVITSIAGVQSTIVSTNEPIKNIITENNKESVNNLSTSIAVKPINNSNTNKAVTGSYQTQKSYYKVKTGDNLGKIADKYNVSVSSLKNWNGLRNDKIYIGQKICIHKKVWVANKTTEVNTDKTIDSDKVNKTTIIDNKTDKIITDTKTSTDIKTTKTTTTILWITYKVKSGDTLWKIANKYGVTVDQIKNNNNLTCDKISIGQVLNIKSK